MKSLVSKLLEHQNDSGKSKILFRLSDIRKVKINKLKIIFYVDFVSFRVSFWRLRWSRGTWFWSQISFDCLRIRADLCAKRSTDPRGPQIPAVHRSPRCTDPRGPQITWQIPWWHRIKFHLKISSLACLFRSFWDFLISEAIIELVWNAFGYWSYFNDVGFVGSSYGSS